MATEITISDAATRPAKLKRRWFQYRLRTLMMLTTLCAFGARWAANPIINAHRQDHAAKEIRAAGGQWWNCRGNTMLPAWAEKFYKCELGRSVSHVEFSEDSGDAELAILDDLPDVHWVLGVGSGVTDAGARYLAKLSRLRQINFAHSKITDAALGSLSSMSELAFLDLRDTKVSEAAVKTFRLAMPYCRVDGPRDE
jgi:hypothetical protein